MVELGLVYGDERLEGLNIIQWLVLFKTIQEKEIQQLKIHIKILKELLGLEIKEGQVLPLSWFINPELVDKIAQTQIYQSDDSEPLTEEEVISIIEAMDTENGTAK